MPDFSSLLIPDAQDITFIQDYTPRVNIEGTKIIDMKVSVGEEGDFSELFRLNEQGKLEIVPDFQLRQINRTNLFAGSIKAWHVHFKQDEIWYLPPIYQLTVGLWDLRKDSPTAGQKYKLILGGGQSRAIYIPHGVAHGSANYSSENVQLFYFVNQQFNMQEPDEYRLHWDAASADFWKPERD